MNIIIKKMIVLALFLASFNAYSAVNETGTITRIIVEGNTMVSVWLSGVDDSTECASGSRWTIASSDLLFKEKVSTLLAAASSGKQVHLHHLTAWGCGNWDSNKIYYVDVTY